MPDFKPTLLRRMLALRQFPIFGTAAIDELATAAENLVTMHWPAGTVIAPAAARLPALQLVVDGCIETRPRGLRWGPRNVFGALEVAANRELTDAAIAATDTETLQLSASDFGEVLEDNFGVLLSTIRDLAGRVLHLVPPRPRSAALAFGPKTLGMVERLIILRQQLPFSRARLQALAALAHASDEVDWPGGTLIVTPGQAADAGLVLIDGIVHVRRPDGTSFTLGPGEPLGYLETLAATEHSLRVETTTSVRALRSTATVIHDVLEDHTDVGVAMLAAFSALLLDTTVN